MPPSHTRGTAAEQGAAIRKQMEERQNRYSSTSSPSYPSHRSRESTAERRKQASASQANAEPTPKASENQQQQPEQGHARQASNLPTTVEKAKPEKKHSGHSETTTAAAHPKPKRTPFNMQRVQGLTGIDNLALLIVRTKRDPADRLEGAG